MLAIGAGLLLSAAGSGSGGALNLTLYHLNPANYSVAPAEMNTADLAGDLYFDVSARTLPLECGNTSSPWYNSDCTNPETNAADLALTKLVVEVVDGAYGPYMFCNVQPPDGHYRCDCNWSKAQKPVPCPPGDHPSDVGRKDLSMPVARARRLTNGTTGLFANTIGRWRVNLRLRTGGYWYSTPTAGWCGHSSGGACTWRLVRPVKKIWKNCSDAVINAEVERRGARCFAGCGARTHNSSDPCWIGCFFDTLLGPGSGEQIVQDGGMTKAEIEALWDLPFSAPAPQGCDNILQAPQPGPPRW